MTISRFLNACDGSDPKVRHGLWSHCRPQIDYIPYCDQLVETPRIDDELGPLLNSLGVPMRIKPSHRNEAPSNNAAAGMTHIDFNRAKERYACDFKLAASGWSSWRQWSEQERQACLKGGDALQADINRIKWEGLAFETWTLDLHSGHDRLF